MKRRKVLVGGIVVIALGFGWYLFRPELLFIDRTVSEQLPASGASGGPAVLVKGNFRGLAHETQGIAAVYQLADGAKTLRLMNFETSNGPDVRVYLVAAPEANDNETVTKAGFVDLGAMKGNIGDQNYDIPAGIDLSKYRTVTIWCRRFGVNFGSASLS